MSIPDYLKQLIGPLPAHHDLTIWEVGAAGGQYAIHVMLLVWPPRGIAKVYMTRYPGYGVQPIELARHDIRRHGAGYLNHLKSLPDGPAV